MQEFGFCSDFGTELPLLLFGSLLELASADLRFDGSGATHLSAPPDALLPDGLGLAWHRKYFGRSNPVFLLLILAQAAHSTEEYRTRMHETFAPAHFVSSLISNDLALGFLVFNVALVTFGLWCWAVPLRAGWHSSRGFVWFWIILELGNGIGHLALALWTGGYFSGVITAPLLLLLAAWLWVLQVRPSRDR